MATPETTFSAQTEASNLAMVEETLLGSRNPPTTGWYNLDPNSYGNFGATYKKTPRDPITKSMQKRKGMLTDEDSGLAIELDVTKDNIDRFGQSIFRSVWKHSGSTGMSLFTINAVTATGYTVDGLGALLQRTLVVARGCDRDENVGLKLVGAGSTNTEIKTPGLVVEASPPDNAVVEVAGFRGASGDIELDTDGNLISTVFDFSAQNLREFQWIYIGGEDTDNRFATDEFYGAARIAVDGIATHKLTLDRRSWEVESYASLDLLSVASNFDTVLQAVTIGTTGNSVTVSAVADGTPAVKASRDMDAGGGTPHWDTVIRAKVAGTAGNSITIELVAGAPTAAGVLTEVGQHVKIQFKATVTASTVADIETLIAGSTLIEVATPGTPGDALDATDVLASVALTGGTDATAPSVVEVGSAVTLHFTPGTTTVEEMEAVITSDATIIEIARPGTPANILLLTADDFGATNLTGGATGDDDGAGKEIDIYYSRWIRNVAMDHADYRKPSICFEATLPDIYDGSDGYEYMLGNMCDEWTWNIPQTSKATVNCTFIGTRSLKLTSTRRTGPADALDPVCQEGVSTMTDVQRLRLSEIDETGISTDFSSAKITAKNNISPEKQVGKRGARIMNQGTHDEMFEADVIFTDPRVINAVRDNTTCTCDFLLRNPDFGVLLDIHSMTLDEGGKKMEKNKSIKVASKGTGFQSDESGSTAGLSVFAYLPPIPEEDQ